MVQDTKVKYPATKVVHWPGQTVACCEKHGSQIEGVGRAMGFPVSFTPASDGDECSNCVNENGGD